MGPAAAQLELLLKSGEPLKHYKLAQVPYALAPSLINDRFRVSKKGNRCVLRFCLRMKRKCLYSNAELVKMDAHDGNDDEHMLLVSYCLSENQRWLLATATNGCGTMFESCMINLSEFTLRNTDQWKAPLPGVYERCSPFATLPPFNKTCTMQTFGEAKLCHQQSAQLTLAFCAWHTVVWLSSVASSDRSRGSTWTWRIAHVVADFAPITIDQIRQMDTR